MPERVEELSKYQNVKDNEIPHYKFGKIIRFERKDVDTWFDTYRREGYAIERRAQEILKKVRGKKSNFPKETSISRENNIPTGKKEDNGCQKFNTCEKTHPSLNTSRGGLNRRKKINQKTDQMLLEAFLNIIARYNLLLDGHPARVFLYSSLLLEKIPITLKEKEKINTAAYLHDIGKLFIKNNILNKNGSLNREEKNYARTHTLNSISVLFHFGFEKDLIEMVLLHHERMDGKGYPFGIKGDEIPLGSKVISIADAFDSMTSYRTYRANPLSPQEAQKELIRCSKTQFDPLLVRLFIGSLNQSKSGKIHINPKSEGEAVCPKVAL